MKLIARIFASLRLRALAAKEQSQSTGIQSLFYKWSKLSYLASICFKTQSHSDYIFFLAYWWHRTDKYGRERRAEKLEEKGPTSTSSLMWPLFQLSILAIFYSCSTPCWLGCPLWSWGKKFKFYWSGGKERGKKGKKKRVF